MQHYAWRNFSTLRSFKDLKNHRIAFEELGDTLQIKKPEEWISYSSPNKINQQTLDQFQQNNGKH